MKHPTAAAYTPARLFIQGERLTPDAPMSFTVFLTAAIVLAVTPGPGILYVMARTLSGGKQDGIASTFGTSLGGLVHVVVAAVGLSAVLAASAGAFAVIKYAGAAYLIFLGLRTLLSAAPTPHADPAPARPAGARRAFLEGILTEALNVKTALFFLAFIPQFVNHHRPAAPQFVLLGLICVTLNTGADLLVVGLASKLMPYLRSSPRPARMMSYGSGAVMVGLGAYLALSDSRGK
jgi:threonine/homoserine/homoserine lactone efflux protein